MWHCGKCLLDAVGIAPVNTFRLSNITALLAVRTSESRFCYSVLLWSCSWQVNWINILCVGLLGLLCAPVKHMQPQEFGFFKYLVKRWVLFKGMVKIACVILN